MRWPGGLYGNGMHDFILMEAELGFRVAAAQDDEDCWTASDMIFFAFMEEEDTDCPECHVNGYMHKPECKRNARVD